MDVIAQEEEEEEEEDQTNDLIYKKIIDNRKETNGNNGSEYVELEEKRNSKMNDNAIAQSIAEAHDLLVRNNTVEAVCAILCSGHRWLFFTVRCIAPNEQQAHHGKKFNALYHGQLNMPCLKYTDNIPFLKAEGCISGLYHDETFDERGMLKVLEAVKCCVSGEIFKFHP
jgi:hypothetical protein